MKRYILFLLIVIPATLLAQNRNRDQNIRNAEQMIKTPQRQQVNIIREAKEGVIISSLGISPDGKTLLYRVVRDGERPEIGSRRNSGGVVEIKKESSTGRAINSRTSRPSEKNGSRQGGSEEGYFFLNLENDQVRRAEVLHSKEFVQWDHNGLYARQNGDLLFSRDGGRRWKVIYRDLYNASDIRVSPNGRMLAFTIEDPGLNYSSITLRKRSAPKHLFLTRMDIPRAEVINVLEESLHEEIRQKPYNPNLELGVDKGFMFTPDNQTLIYVNKKNEDQASINTNIFKYSIPDRKTINVTQARKGYDGDIKMSPDGTKIAWITTFNDGQNETRYILVSHLKTGKQVNVTQAWKGSVDGDFSWSNESDRIHFISNSGLNKGLFSVFVSEDAKRCGDVEFFSSGKGELLQTILAGYGHHLIVESTDSANENIGVFWLNLRGGQMERLVL